MGLVTYIQCDYEACESQKNTLGLLNRDPPERHQDFKFVFDVDGNTYSGRFPKLIHSGALIFKMTIFTEFFTKWLKPYVHYIPVSPDYSDLEAQVQWAIENDEKAREIAQNGRQFALKYMRNEQIECYSEMLFLEMGRLQTGKEMVMKD